MERKNKISELLAHTYQTEIHFTDDLDAAESSEVGTLEQWSAKDNLIHCAYWIGELADNLAAVAKGEPPQRSENINQINDAIFESHRFDTWEITQAAMHDSFQRLNDQTQRLSEADLDSLEFFHWQKGRPVWRIIVGNGVLHPLAHLAGYASHHTGVKRILAAYEAILPGLSELDESPSWQSLLQYDLACFCALAGLKKQAIQSLGKSLSLSPDYAAWAQQDTDLDSLREEQEYKALFAS